MKEGQHTVLLVDDDTKLLRALERGLRNERFRSLTAVGPAEAAVLLKSYSVDVIVSDNQMVGMTGTEFLAQVRRDYPDVIPIVLTGSISKTDAFRMTHEIGVYYLLNKPCNANTLATVIWRALEEKGNQTAVKPIA